MWVGVYFQWECFAQGDRGPPQRCMHRAHNCHACMGMKISNKVVHARVQDYGAKYIHDHSHTYVHDCVHILMYIPMCMLMKLIMYITMYILVRIKTKVEYDVAL